MINLFNIVTFELKHILYPILYIIIGLIVYEIAKKVITNMTNKTEKNLKPNQLQRIKTIRQLMINVVKYIIIILVLLGILATFGVNVTSFLAGLGITSVIAGLALQDLAKDIIAGISIITEGQYEVGDWIEVDGFMGEVIFVGLRSTKIRDYKGAIKIISNHYIDNIINYSMNNSLAVVDVIVGQDQDPEKVEKVLNNLEKNMNGKIEDATGPIQILGIEDLQETGIRYRVTVETKPMQQYGVQRILRKEIRKTFNKENIAIPYTKIEVENGK